MKFVTLENLKLNLGSFFDNIISPKLNAKADKSETTTNLLNPTLKTTSRNGITCTNNGDGTYTLNGTNTSASNVTFVISVSIKIAKKVKIIGCPTTDGSVMLQTEYDGSWATPSNWDTGNGATVDDATKINALAILVRGSRTIDNLVFKPMITTNLDATYDDFISYTGDQEALNKNIVDIKKDILNIESSINIEGNSQGNYKIDTNNKVVNITDVPPEEYWGITDFANRNSKHIDLLIKAHNSLIDTTLKHTTVNVDCSTAVSNRPPFTYMGTSPTIDGKILSCIPKVSDGNWTVIANIASNETNFYVYANGSATITCEVIYI